MDYSFYSTCYPDYLIHYGVKGMKWGHRKARSQAYVDAANRAQMAKAQYKQAKVDARAAAKAERNTPEAKAARRKKALKVGAAVAGTALAAYGAYKLNNYVKANHTLIEAKRGHDYAQKMFEDGVKRATEWEKAPITPGVIRETVTIANNSGRDAMDAARQASRDNFVTAAKNVVDYRRQNGKNALGKLRSLDYYTTGGNQIYKFTKGR